MMRSLFLVPAACIVAIASCAREETPGTSESSADAVVAQRTAPSDAKPPNTSNHPGGDQRAAVTSGRRHEDFKQGIEYGDYDLTKALKVLESKDGERQYAVDMQLVDEVIGDLAKHAKNYPPRFQSNNGRIRAERDVRALYRVFDIVADKDDVEVQILLRAGFLGAIGHNLDVESSDEKATHYFERLLQKQPDHPQANYHYGVFLASTATKQKESVKYLQKAVELGVDNATFSLGLAYLSLGDQRKSLENLEEFARRHPDHLQTKTLIDAIKSGKVAVKKKLTE